MYVSHLARIRLISILPGVGDSISTQDIPIATLVGLGAEPKPRPRSYRKQLLELYVPHSMSATSQRYAETRATKTERLSIAEIRALGLLNRI
jgi:hypothetical protein